MTSFDLPIGFNPEYTEETSEREKVMQKAQYETHPQLLWTHSKDISLKIGRQIYAENRRDIARILRVCPKNISYCRNNEISPQNAEKYLKISIHEKNSKYYYELNENTWIKHNEWKANGPNCAVFAWNSFAIFLNNYEQPKWDKGFFGSEAKRPEEFRRFLLQKAKDKDSKIQVDVIYRPGNWEGKDDNNN